MSSDSDDDVRKIKRRPRKQKFNDEEEDFGNLPIVDLAIADLDLLTIEEFMSTLRRLPKRNVLGNIGTQRGADGLSSAAPEWSELETTTEPYPYVRLLQRAMQLVQRNNPELRKADQVVNVIAPKIQRDGPRKTSVTNFQDVCMSMSRTAENVMDFLLKEFSTTGNLDGNRCLILKGVFKETNVEKALRKYMDEYVICASCRSANTTVTKDTTTRLNVVKCEVCSAARTVQSVTAGYAAQTTRRAILRAKQT